MTRKRFIKLSVVSIFCCGVLPAYAARPVDLSHQSFQYLKSLSASGKARLGAAAGPAGAGLEEVSQTVDFNQTVHTRVKQTFSGYPVFGGDAVIHTPHGGQKTLRSLMVAGPEASSSTMNGVIYEDLQKDLQNTPDYVFNQDQARKAFSQAISDYESRAGVKVQVRHQRNQLMVYVDSQNKAHWAFQISAYVKANGRLAKPAYILDALDFHVYKTWDDRKTASADSVKGGGMGGNLRTGKLMYDGLPGSLASLEVTRDAAKNICYLQNSLARVTDWRTQKTASYRCAKPDGRHASIYWNEGGDHVNGGYSPNNDALFAAKTINAMYQDWYGIPVLQKNGQPMVMEMETHSAEEGENAEWDDIQEKMMFGDGGNTFYPLTSLGVTAHEISHGFTSQHSNLVYDDQSGGMNESFSDMADQAAKYYATGKNDWMIGSEVAKPDDFALRYLDDPAKDCKFVEAGDDCSISSAKLFRPGLNVHLSSGVYNRAFYLLATTPGWNVRKAFDVMVQANRSYWVPTSTFEQGACGVIKAAADYKYDTAAVVSVFDKVGVITSQCA
ncbi:Zinc metalloproteinase [Aquicella siphonis]|uniref:Neutral metalloproteinase n=1 Tax=Aquicella siphonis TaxID=254247 RepID=A0A5E4PD19_9COXI|nr:M4 family metallopeptidase [Aquicella siphonis]VVC74760.1 Zinc metalloproteinase [Aquicella siphonis]